MANFYHDNEDLVFLFSHMDFARLAQLAEEDFRFADEFDHAPRSVGDALDNYQRVLETIGDIAANVVAPTAEHTDRVGSMLNANNTVSYAPGIVESLRRLSQADLMGFTLPYKYGGINCPTLLYTFSNDIISRADASLMNLYGLQGIAETINAFASDEIKDEYLPPMASGKYTGAMVLTEPDAGSDLQAVKVRAYQDEAGDWYVQGVKRFITNGCGEVLLVLARSEADVQDGRGLSLFLVESGARVKVRRLEEKLGIHGSPTCELFFDDAPAKLIGERQRGLVTYVMSLMNGARIGIAAQSLGIGEAAYRVARDYAHKRRQFNTAIETIPAVRELLVEMSLDVKAARALTYYASFSVDLEYGATRAAERDNVDAEAKKQAKQDARRLKRINGLLTPMCKYYASEMSMRVANQAMAVLGGSGYMRDYAVERLVRDSRITTIYEGTSQLQVVAAVRGVMSGTIENIIDQLFDHPWPESLQPLVDQVGEAMAVLNEAIAFIKEQAGGEYMELYGRRLVDMACAILIAALFVDHATAADKKRTIAQHWLDTNLPRIKMNRDMICSGDRSIIKSFEELAGALPTIE
jgi:alkylation response protein AidB-like acyl-CoA dehydrogenase